MKGMKEKTILAIISFFTLTILFAQPAKFPIKNQKFWGGHFENVLSKL